KFEVFSSKYLCQNRRLDRSVYLVSGSGVAVQDSFQLTEDRSPIIADPRHFKPRTSGGEPCRCDADFETLVRIAKRELVAADLEFDHIIPYSKCSSRRGSMVMAV